MSSHPFEPRKENPFEATTITYFAQRDSISPTFYNWRKVHPEPSSIKVTQRGKPIQPGFTVDDVAPEHRWAIGPDGEVIDQMEFADKLERCREEYYRYHEKPSTGDPNLRPVPRVERYVSRMVDPDDDTRLIPIEPPPPDQPAVLRNQYTSDGAPVAVNLQDPRTQELIQKNNWRVEEQSTQITALEEQLAEMKEMFASLVSLDGGAPSSTPKTPAEMFAEAKGKKGKK